MGLEAYVITVTFPATRQQPFKITLAEDEDVKDLKKAVAKALGHDSFTLSFKGKPLDNDAKEVAELGIKTDAVIEGVETQTPKE